jgi:hypothetical protein
MSQLKCAAMPGQSQMFISLEASKVRCRQKCLLTKLYRRTTNHGNDTCDATAAAILVSNLPHIRKPVEVGLTRDRSEGNLSERERGKPHMQEQL